MALLVSGTSFAGIGSSIKCSELGSRNLKQIAESSLMVSQSLGRGFAYEQYAFKLPELPAKGEETKLIKRLIQLHLKSADVEVISVAPAENRNPIRIQIENMRRFLYQTYYIASRTEQAYALGPAWTLLDRLAIPSPSLEMYSINHQGAFHESRGMATLNPKTKEVLFTEFVQAKD